MVYTPATKLPDLELFRWSRPDAANPRLSSPLLDSDADDTLKFTSAPLDYDGNVITGATLVGVKNIKGYTEIILIPAGGLSADGLTATNCIRGIRPNGLDFTTGDSDFIAAHEKDSPVFCAVSAVYHEIVKSALRGELATNGSNFIIGTDASGTVTVSRSTGVGTFVGFLRWNTGSGKAEFSNNGSVWNTIDSVTASNLVVVSNDDTTPGDLEAKMAAGTNVTLTTLNPAGNEQRQINVPATNLANIVSDVTATATELNQVNDGVSANVTAANLNTLTAGSASNADALHTHATLGPFNYTTAEAVNGSVTPQAVCILGTNAIDFITQRSSSGYLLDYGAGGDVDLGFGDVATSTRRATPFTYTNSLPTTRNLVKIAVMLQKEVAPTDNVVLAIQGDSGGNPDGTDITTATFSGSSLISGAFHVIEFTISGAALVSGTQYWAVLRRSTGLDAVNHYAVRSSGNAGTGGKVFNAGTGTWANGNPFQMYLTIELDYDGGEIALADGDSNYLGNFIGFTKSNVASSGTAAVQTQGVVTGFTGLTPGAPYYLSTTAGAISLTPSNVRVGFAKSATELEINPSFGTVQSIVSNTYTFRCREGNSVAGEDFSFVVLTGFMPNFVSWSDRLSPSAASETAMGWTENYRGSTRAIQRISALDTSARTVNVQSVVSNASGAFTNLDAYYDNGFILSNTPSLAAQLYYELNYRANRI